LEKLCSNDEHPSLRSFSLLYDESGLWIERELAGRVRVLMNARKQRSKDDIPQSMVVLLFQFFQPFSHPNYESDLIPILAELVSEMNTNDEFYSLLVFFIKRLPNSPMLDAVTAKITIFTEQPPASLPHVVSELVRTFAAIQAQSRTVVTAHSPEVLQNIARQRDQIASRSAERPTAPGRHWRMLWQQLSILFT
jgi:hypothetical protein